MPRGGSKPVHGLADTPTHWAWSAMLQRCNNSNNPRWLAYGGRGIEVCNRWMTFLNFLADMGVRPEGKRGKRSLYSVERRDNDGDYSPGNCYWGTVDDQKLNKRDRDFSFTNSPIYRQKMSNTANRRWKSSKE